jgi:integrase
MERTLHQLRDAGRADILGLLAARRLRLIDVHEAFLRRGDELERLKASCESPELGALVDEWLDHLRSPAGISPRTKRPYAPETIRRYGVSWHGFFEVLPKGRTSGLADITSGFISDYKVRRVRAEGGSARNTRTDGSRPAAATVNRDLIALTSFLRWCREDKGFTVPNLKIVREREPRGRERWLSATEIHECEAHCPTDWWVLFALLIQTGMRIGEAQGLLWGDLYFSEARIVIHEGSRRVKTASSVRHVPIPEALSSLLAQHALRVPSEPADPVFPGALGKYGAARRAWQKLCVAAGLHDGGSKKEPNARIHDLRHTFGVAAAKAGVPLVRIQKLMGHSSPHMTMRYMKHAPEAHFAEDAASISDALLGRANDEERSRADSARRALKCA